MDKRKFFLSRVEDNLIPYWLKWTDRRNGGILNCISNDGETLVSDDKYLWSQGRWLYILSILALNREVFANLDSSLIETLAGETFAFIKNYGFDKDYRAVFRASASGKRYCDENGEYSTSIYADCFLVLGISKYAELKKDLRVLKIAENLMESIKRRIERGSFLTKPYEIPPRYMSHGIPMILLNTLQTFISALHYFSVRLDVWSMFQDSAFDAIWDIHFDRKKGIIREYVSLDGYDPSSLLARHINPGHTLEDAWFMIEYLEVRGVLDQYINEISSLVKRAFNLAWDKEYGGLFRFVDEDGGKPHGKTGGSSYEDLVLSTWDMKLWWPHSEMLYLFLLMRRLTDDSEYKAMFDQVFSYVFSTFESKTNGEWNQIRMRDGREADMVVALPVKDPFHILRDFIKIILLEERYGNKEY